MAPQIRSHCESVVRRYVKVERLRYQPKSRKSSETWGIPCSFFLPASSLQHLRLIQRADGEALHRALQVFAHFK